jgi:hypothetical protein
MEEAIREIVKEALEDLVGEIVKSSVKKAFKQQNQEEILVSNLSDVRIQKILNDIRIKFLKVSAFLFYSSVYCI